MTPRMTWIGLLTLALVGGCSGKKDGAEKQPAGDSKPATENDGKPAGQTDGKPDSEPTAAPAGAAANAKYKPLATDPGGAQGKALWAARLGGLEMDVARGVAVNAMGSVAVTGYLSNGADFGDGKPVEAAKKDVYVARYNADGSLAWATSFGGAGEDGGYSVTFDGSDNVIVVGLFSGEMKIGEDTLKSQGSDDVFFAKFGADGTPQWARLFGGPDSDVAYDVATRDTGNILVTGSFKGTVQTPDGPLTSKGNEDIFVLELDPKGGLLWVRQFGDRHEDYGQAIAVDEAGHLVVLGEFSGTVSFGGEPLTSVGNQDLYVAKLDQQGRHIWSQRFGGAFNELGMGLATDPAGNIAFTGSFDNEIKFGDKALASQGESDVFVAKLSSAGAVQWAHSFGGAREDVGQGLDVDQYGNIAVGGMFWQSVDFGGGAVVAAGQNRDGFLLKLSPEGKHLWSKRMGDKDHDRLRSVAMTRDGRVAAAGIFRFGFDLGIEAGPLQSARKPDDKAPPSDVFVALFDR